MQVTRYEHGQFFRMHGDAYSRATAAEYGFQRRATLLLYLNDVPEGGETRFEMLGVSIGPTAGTAILFFPAFADGSGYPRTIHTASDAVSTKWIAQQWVSSGWSEPPVSFVGVSARPSETLRKGGKRKKKKQ